MRSTLSLPDAPLENADYGWLEQRALAWAVVPAPRSSPTGRLAYTGHGDNTGGLQRHSIGDSYPFAVVGCMVARLGDRECTSATTRYYVLDAATGKRYVRHDGRTFFGATGAHRHARLLHDMPEDRRELYEWRL